MMRIVRSPVPEYLREIARLAAQLDPTRHVRKMFPPDLLEELAPGLKRVVENMRRRARRAP